MATATAKLSFDETFLRDAVQLDVVTLREVAKFVIEQIVLKARGFKKGTDDAGNDVNLPGLSQSYQDQRKGLVHFRNIRGRAVSLSGRDPDLKLDRSKTNPGQRTSNLTLSGALLDSLNCKVIDREDRIEISFPRTKHPNASITFEELYEILLQKNKRYEILNIDRRLRSRIIKRISDEVNRKISRLSN